VGSAGVQPLDEVSLPTKTARLASPGKAPLLLLVLLLAATLFVYLPVRHHPFVNLDDGLYVTSNIQVKSGLSVDTLVWAFTTFQATNWHPLTWISHALDCQMFGLDPAGPHMVNVLLHLVDVLLVFWVLWRATGYAGRSLMVAGLFALHPLNVESVAWIAERKTMLSMVFFLLALAAYRWYASGPRISRYVVVALLFILGLMAKPQVITLPFVFLLWDYWPLGRLRFSHQPPDVQRETEMPARSLYSLVREKVPLFVLSLMSALLTMKAQGVGGPKNWSFTFTLRLENAIVSYARYVLKAFWPTGLAPMYIHPGESIRLGQAAPALIFLLIVTALVVAGWRRRYLAVGWLWFLGTMVPMSGIIQAGRQSMADRYAYLPFLGLFIMVCWTVADWAETRHLPAAVLPTVSVVVLAALATVTYRQVGYWKDDVTLWSHTLEVTSNNWVGEYQMGIAFKQKGQMDQAAQHFFKALAINSTNADINLAVAVYEHQSGNLQAAIEPYNKVLAKTDDQEIRYKVLINLGHVYDKLGDSVRAKESFDAAAKLKASQ
jgi:hypothetical protein